MRETPARSAKLRESPPPSAAHKAHVAAPSHKAASKTARAPKPPKGATALCKDGSYTDNKKPKKGCKKHEGVARVLRGSGRRDLNPRPPEPHSGALPGCATSRPPLTRGQFIKVTPHAPLFNAESPDHHSPMLSPRMSRRLVRHHASIAIATAAALVLTYAITASPNPVYRWSMATAYAGLALLGATLATGPVNILRRRPNPVSTDLRRDLGIWAGLVSFAHFLVGWQVHMKHRYLYWLREDGDHGALLPRTDLFGFGNYTGLAAVLIALLLLALSSDRFLRTLGTTRWKRLQRWNYALFLLVAAHGIAYQLIEKRKTPFVVAFALLTVASVAVQYAGYRRVRRVRRAASAPDGFRRSPDASS